MVEGCIGQHYAQGITGRCDCRCCRAARALREQYDGSAVRLEERRLAFIHLAELASRLQVECHQRERLGLAMLSLPQALHSLPVECITGEVVASQSLDGQDCTLCKLLGRCGDWIGRATTRLPRPYGISNKIMIWPIEQALGWAWKRRLPGSSYSDWQFGGIEQLAQVSVR